MQCLHNHHAVITLYSVMHDASLASPLRGPPVGRCNFGKAATGGGHACRVHDRLSCHDTLKLSMMFQFAWRLQQAVWLCIKHHVSSVEDDVNDGNSSSQVNEQVAIASHRCSSVAAFTCCASHMLPLRHVVWCTVQPLLHTSLHKSAAQRL